MKLIRILKQAARIYTIFHSNNSLDNIAWVTLNLKIK